MSSIGIIGAGKLGLPLGVAAALSGYTVFLHDENPERNNPDWIKHEPLPIDKVRSQLRYEGLDSLLYHCNMVFVCVQTQHDPQFDGTRRIADRLPEEFPDFDYSALKAVCTELKERDYRGTICIVSTVLPGTIEGEILPMPGPVVYSPQFMAMGQALYDFLHPDIVVAGGTHREDTILILDFFRNITEDQYKVRCFSMDIMEAEAVKILYNTYISLKIGFSNSVQMFSGHYGLRASRMLKALQVSRRITGPDYLGPGMGDGGACHPRDNLALAGLIAQEQCTYNFPLDAMRARQQYASEIADRLIDHAILNNLPICILGVRYKKDCSLTDGSHALLVADYIGERREHKLYDPYADKPLCPDGVYETPHVYLLAVPDIRLLPVNLPKGSVLVNPWGMAGDNQSRDNVHIDKLGA